MFSVCVFVLFVNEMFFRPADDTRSVWESSSLPDLSSPTSSLAYISSINPVLGGLLWSLCVLWAMVIISLLRSHCFMRLFCSIPPIPRSLSFSLSYSHYMSPNLTDSPFCCVMLHPCPLSLLHFRLLLFATYFHFSRPSSHRFHFLSFASCYLTHSLLHRCKYSNLIYKKLLKGCTRKVDHVET